MAFVLFNPEDLAQAKTLVNTYKKLAREEYGREIQVWAASYMVQGETEKEAHDFYRYYVHEKGDWEAATNLVNTLGLNSENLESGYVESNERAFHCRVGRISADRHT